jgi:hypothetical protein
MLYHQGVSTSFMFFVSRAETLAGAALYVAVAAIARLAAHRSRPRVPPADAVS